PEAFAAKNDPERIEQALAYLARMDAASIRNPAGLLTYLVTRKAPIPGTADLSRQTRDLRAIAHYKFRQSRLGPERQP
ncbi:MAG: hypothetical protein HY688_04580, partial [Chloroflexi bacterium]|nr:hypothetical protein [Chloroflexota bacterium]